MNLEGWKKMNTMMNARQDEKMGAHIDWSEDEMAQHYSIWCKIFGLDEATGLAHSDFKNMEPVYMGAMASMGGAAQ